MTAEIAIINRSAITLAADSAMTLSVGGRRKVYTSTDKIFELSENDPIGLMIYNNLEFMGAPVDVLIKLFRSSPDCCRFSVLTDAPPKFFAYLTTQWKPSTEIEHRHVWMVLTAFFNSAWSDFQEKFKALAPAERRRLSVDLLVRCVAEMVTKLELLPVAECFSDVSEAEISDLYLDLIDSVIGQVFLSPPLEDDSLNICRRFGVLCLHRETFSDMLSGLVFAGFGKADVFPTLVSYHTDGIIAGRLKIKEMERVVTGRDQVSAKVIPFAQREVVDRFLEGIDPGLEAGAVAYFTEALNQTKDALFHNVKRLGSAAKAQLMQNLDESLGKSVADFQPVWLKETKKSYSKQTEDMVLFMAKQESAHLAESLVNITSLKRKYSADEESVAGPIDVAVISRSDGFIWVRRKHYFQAELNQRYFARKYGRLIYNGESRDAEKSN